MDLTTSFLASLVSLLFPTPRARAHARVFAVDHHTKLMYIYPKENNDGF